jgi:hypothetical protein
VFLERTVCAIDIQSQRLVDEIMHDREGLSAITVSVCSNEDPLSCPASRAVVYNIASIRPETLKDCLVCV